MILSDRAIIEALDAGDIVIEPFLPEQLGSNSYDVRLGPELAVYDVPCDVNGRPKGVLDPKERPQVIRYLIPEQGAVLLPGILYLGSTIERTYTPRHVPNLDGKSSVGRYGISIHATAGRGDVGFAGHWTLEISVVQPVRVYAGMKIGQITFHAVQGDVITPYDQKPDAKYRNQAPMPVPSEMHKNF